MAYLAHKRAVNDKKTRVLLNSFSLRICNHGNTSTYTYIIGHDKTSKLILFNLIWPATEVNFNPKIIQSIHRRTKKLKISPSIHLQSKKSPQIDLDDVSPVSYLQLVSENTFVYIETPYDEF